MKQHFVNLIDVLSATVGTRIEIGSESRVFCDFDEFPVLIEFLESAEQILLAVSLGTPPERNREEFYRKLLQGQYLFHQTGGATLALDVEGRFVTLQAVKDIRVLTAQNFPVFMENFLRVAEYWHGQCQGEPQAVSGAGEQDEDPPIDQEGMLRI
jgi:hypothetical protein